MLSRQSFFARLILLGGTLYCGALVALTLAWALLPMQPWWLAIADDVLAPLLFLPVAVLLVAAWSWRSRLLGAAVLLAVVAFGASFHAALLPRTVDTSPGTPLRVVTYNHLYRNQQIDDIVALIREQRADIVALQELSSAVAGAVDAQLSDEYPYQWLLPAENSTGLGLLSRYPLEAQVLASNRREQRAVVRLDGHAVTVINVHPTTPFIDNGRGGIRGMLSVLPTYGTGRRQNQLAALLQTIDATTGPLIVLGDFNTSDRDPLYQAFSARLRDAYRETTWGFGKTFPTNTSFGWLPVPPMVRIDYVWSRDGVSPRAARVECASAGSDHCMLIADLSLTLGQSSAEGRT